MQNVIFNDIAILLNKIWENTQDLVNMPADIDLCSTNGW